MSFPSNPDQISAKAKSAYQEGDYRKAAELFQTAADGFSMAGDTLSAAEMANNRSVALLQDGEAANALQAVEVTIQEFADAGDKRRQAMALGNRAAALNKLNRVEEAISDYQQAADIFKEIGEHELRASVLQALSMLQLRSGNQLQSLASMTAGLNEYEQPKPRQRFLRRLLDIPLKFFLK